MNSVKKSIIFAAISICAVFSAQAMDHKDMVEIQKYTRSSKGFAINITSPDSETDSLADSLQKLI